MLVCEEDLIISLLPNFEIVFSSGIEIFRELGGARLAHNMVPYMLCRKEALHLVSTLLLSTSGEDDMSTLLGLMHTAQMEDLELKNSVLKVIIV